MRFFGYPYNDFVICKVQHNAAGFVSSNFRLKGECSVFKKNVLWMKTMHYPNTIRSHLVTIVPMAPFTPKSTSKLRSALHIRYSIVLLLSTHSSLIIGGSPLLLSDGGSPPASPASHLAGLLRRRDPSTNPGPIAWWVSVGN